MDVRLSTGAGSWSPLMPDGTSSQPACKEMGFGGTTGECPPEQRGTLRELGKAMYQ